MANNNIALTAGIRSNLLLLQQSSTLLEKTQLRLATGNKINTALDGPAAFFASKGLSQRAGDLDGLKDGIGQAISTLKGAASLTWTSSLDWTLSARASCVSVSNRSSSRILASGSTDATWSGTGALVPAVAALGEVGDMGLECPARRRST